jgi:hypothetical protein
MDNPWLKYGLGGASKVHSDDLAMFEQVNTRILRKKTNSLDFLLSENNVPLPYFGNPNANFVVLYANPGLDRKSTHLEETPEGQKLFDLSRRHELKEPHPFVFLHPILEGTPGQRWWTQTLGSILTRFSESPNRVLENILSVEYHPYKSVKFEALTKSEGHFPTSQYSYDLVARAIDRGALVLVSRAKKQWFDAVPELRSYSRVIYLSSAQNSKISPNNVRYVDNPHVPDIDDQKNLAWQLITKVALSLQPGDTGLPGELDRYIKAYRTL